MEQFPKSTLTITPFPSSLSVSCFEPYPTTDYYALDTMCFSQMERPETWKLRNFTQFSSLFVCFLGLRSWAHQDQFGKPIRLSLVSSKFRKGLIQSGAEEIFSFEVDSGFKAELVDSSSHNLNGIEKKENSKFGYFTAQSNSFEKSFLYKKSSIQGSELASGSFGASLTYPASLKWLQSVQDLEKDSNSESKSYFRSPEHNFLYLIQPSSGKRLFVQEKQSLLGNLLMSHSRRFKDSTVFNSL